MSTYLITYLSTSQGWFKPIFSESVDCAVSVVSKHSASAKPAWSRLKTKITHRIIAGTEIKFNSEAKIYVGLPT